MNILNEKLNVLSNELAVTENVLMESLLDKPEKFDIDLYLSIQAVLIDTLRVDPKEIRNLIKTLSNRNQVEDIQSFLIETKNDFDQTNEKESLIVKIFGKYMFVKGYVLLNKLNEIFRYKAAIETI